MPVTLIRTTKFKPLIAPYCPQCPDFLIEKMVRLASIDFAERSRSWRHIVTIDITEDPFATILTGTIDGEVFDLLFTVGVNEYLATTGTYPGGGTAPVVPLSAIHEFEFAEFNGQRLEPIQFSTMNAAQEGNPRYITQVEPGIVSLIPFRTGKLNISIFLKPSADSEYGTDPDNPMFDRFNVVPDFFLSMYGNTIAAGALSRILTIPDEPWSNPIEGLRYDAIYQGKADGSFRANMRGQQRAPIRTRYRDF